MKVSSIEWLLDPKDPSIRFHTLIDLLDRPISDKDVVATKERIRNYGPVKRIMAGTNRDGYWPPKKTCYLPKWTAAAWPPSLQGGVGEPGDHNNRGEGERCFALAADGTG